MLCCSSDPLILANHYAKMSSIRWNQSDWQPKTAFGKQYKAKVVDKMHQFSRRKYQRKYREMAENACCGTQYRFLSEITQFNDIIVNTYPWPYVDPDFANLENAEVCDQSGCLVRSSASYCAWKIYEVKGRWPKFEDGLSLDAKDWPEAMLSAGYNQRVERPTGNHCYVGINPDDTIDGMAVWFERYDGNGNIKISTYRDNNFSPETIRERNIENYIWFFII